MRRTECAILAAGLTLAAGLAAQPNPYRTVEHWFTLPEGRTMGSTSSVFVAPDGHIWVAERCGANTCAGSSVAPILEFDESGKVLKNFGANLFVFPHSILLDSGKILMTLGKAGVEGDGPDTFNQPNSVAIARDGAIFVSDGHNAGH
jgi:hypothetical protein